MGPLLIIICTVIWGTAFLFQKTGAEHYGPFTLTCYRNILAGCLLWLVCRIAPKIRFLRALTASSLPPAAGRRPQTASHELLGGILSGMALFAAMSTQQLGIEHTTPYGKNMELADFVCNIDVSSYPDGTYTLGSANHFTITHNGAKNTMHHAYTFGDAYKFTVTGGYVTSIGGVENN